MESSQSFLWIADVGSEAGISLFIGKEKANVAPLPPLLFMAHILPP